MDKLRLEAVAALVDSRARAQETRVSEMERDLTVRLVKLETLHAEAVKVDPHKWFQRTFWAFMSVILAMLVVSWQLVSLNTRTSDTKDEVSKITPAAQERDLRIGERFVRAELKLEGLTEKVGKLEALLEKWKPRK